MQYTNYFGRHFKEHGQPHLNHDCFKRYFNLVCLENKIDGMELLKKKYKGTSDYFKYDMEIDKLKRKVLQITTNHTPESFLLELLKVSANY